MALRHRCSTQVSDKRLSTWVRVHLFSSLHLSSTRIHLPTIQNEHHLHGYKEDKSNVSERKTRPNNRDCGVTCKSVVEPADLAFDHTAACIRNLFWLTVRRCSHETPMYADLWPYLLQFTVVGPLSETLRALNVLSTVSMRH